MANQSATEQLVLELINRARLDPLAEALRFGIALNEGVPPGDTISSAAKQPLAMNDQLLAAARGHSEAMVNDDTPPVNSRDFFEHNNPHTGSTSQSRIDDSGYVWTTIGENIAFNGSTGAINVNALAVQEHAGLFIDAGVDERGHRVNLINPAFKEIGVGIASGDFNPPNDGDANTYNSVLMTQDFGARNANRILTGVAYNETVVNNDFYDIGEARAGVQVKVGAVLKATGGLAGGYSGDIGNGAMNLSFSGGGLVGTLTVAIGAGTDNVKLDVVDGTTIFSSASLTLVSGVTRAKLLGIANINLVGAGTNDLLIGNNGNNVFNGKAGADTTQGLRGNNSYVVDNGGDRIVGEGAGFGTDNISASVSFSLNAGAQVETLRTAAPTATTAINLSGNEFANIVTGNAGNNVLNGRGGNDTLQGGAGNNSYFVDSVADKIVEATGQGTDNVNASVSYALASNVAVETLRTAAPTATTTINLTGNNLANTIIGNAGSNAINGGLGNDVLSGGAGNDVFTFSTTLNGSTNSDTVTDFNVAQDTIRIDNAVFTALTTTGTLAATAFRTGAGAGDANDRIIYNDTSGALLYDADGTGPTAAIQFAKVTVGLVLTNADFVVV